MGILEKGKVIDAYWGSSEADYVIELVDTPGPSGVGILNSSTDL